MAKENEKKVSAELNEEELENVAGGWCMTGGASVPDEVKSIEKENDKNGKYDVIITFQNGKKTRMSFNPDGTVYGCGERSY